VCMLCVCVIVYVNRMRINVLIFDLIAFSARTCSQLLPQFVCPHGVYVI